MLKAAYQKLFLNKTWPAVAGGAAITLFMYVYLTSLNIDEETRNLVIYTFLGMNGLCFLLALYQTAWGLWRVLSLRAYLNRMPDLVRDRLEYFQCRREETLQPRLTGPTPASEGRAVFMKYYRRLSFPRLLQEIDGEKFLEEVEKSQREDPHG